MENLSTGYTWDEAPENLKKVALHLSNVLKIDKTEASNDTRKNDRNYAGAN